MPRFQVVEVRSFYEGYVIDAVDRKAAESRDGEIIDEQSNMGVDSWGERIHSIEEVDVETEEVELP